MTTINGKEFILHIVNESLPGETKYDDKINYEIIEVRHRQDLIETLHDIMDNYFAEGEDGYIDIIDTDGRNVGLAEISDLAMSVEYEGIVIYDWFMLHERFVKFGPRKCGGHRERARIANGSK